MLTVAYVSTTPWSRDFNFTTIKGIVRPEMKILALITRPRVIPHP